MLIGMVMVHCLHMGGGHTMARDRQTDRRRHHLKPLHTSCGENLITYHAQQTSASHTHESTVK